VGDGDGDLHVRRHDHVHACKQVCSCIQAGIYTYEVGADVGAGVGLGEGEGVGLGEGDGVGDAVKRITLTSHRASALVPELLILSWVPDWPPHVTV
jgi:hypothetical protein